MSDVDHDGFKIVKSKRKSKNIQIKKQKDFRIEREENLIDIDKVIKRIQLAVEDLKVSDYLKHCSEAVSTVLQDKTIVEIVCFGLGRISECNISRYQLALLLCFKDLFSPIKVLVHDPIFSKSECNILKNLDLKVINENCEGNYKISDNGVTLAYFPHCPKQLTNNFLWSNWSVNLHNCLLICNSFTSLIDNNPDRIVSESVPYIYKIHQHCKEIHLENIFRFTDIFNDTSLHHFPYDNLTNLDIEFWSKDKKPCYENTEEFITSLMVKNLNISSEPVFSKQAHTFQASCD